MFPLAQSLLQNHQKETIKLNNFLSSYLKFIFYYYFQINLTKYFELHYYCFYNLNYF